MAVLDWLQQQLGSGPRLRTGGALGEAGQPAGWGYGDYALQHLDDVISGKVAKQGALGQNNYNPSQSFAQNALNPAALAQAEEIAGGIGPGAIRAFHGSPHSFDRFDINKIGTGEGAQAYGHGLYFAEREPIARQYRDQLSPKTIDDLPLDEVIKRGAGDTLAMRAPTNESIIADYIQSYGDVPSARFMLDRKNRLDLVEMLDEMEKAGRIKAGGHMYEVDIHADPKAFLDWDKSLGQQSQEVRDALTKGGAYQGPSMSLGGDAAGAVLKRAVTSPYHAADLFNKGGDPLELTMPEVSQRLNQSGIPGIRYLDQGSRGAGTGSSNYAIFDPKIIEILRKYGIVPPIVAGGLLGAGSEPPT